MPKLEINNKIIELYNNKWTNLDISIKVSVHRNTVSSVIKYYELTGKIKENNKKNKKYSNDLKNIITKINEKDTIIRSVNKLITEINAIASLRTIQRYLKENKIIYGNVIKKPRLSEKHKIARIEWAMKNFGTDWSKIIFSDEMTIWLDKKSNKCLYKTGNKKIIDVDRYSKKYNVWACITLGGIETFFIFEENMNSEMYMKILEVFLLPIYKKDYLFQQDNHSVHKSKTVINFFEENKINLLEFPAKSPDLNPIENIWGVIKKDISNRTDVNKDIFLNIIEETLKNIKYSTVFNCVASMPNRLSKVIDQKGHAINY